jgi:hypothetical protein
MQLTRLLPFGFAITCASLAAPAPEPTALAVLPRIHSNEYINYTTLTGFFLQDDPATSTTGFDYVRMQFWRQRERDRMWLIYICVKAAVNFGLINRTYSTDNEVPADWTQWQKFDHYVWRLNRGSGRFVQYKVLYMG